MSDLFDTIDLPAQRHSPTSIAAADGAKQTARLKREIVLMHLKAAYPDGLTDEEIDDRTGFGASTSRPRRVELCQREHCPGGVALVRDSGKTRKTKKNKSAVVWVWVGEQTTTGEQR